MSLLRWLRAQPRIAWRDTRFAVLGLPIPKPLPGISIENSLRRRAHTALAYLIARVVASVTPLVGILIASELAFELDLWTPATIVVASVCLGGQLAGRILYRYASRHYEATRTHDVMKAVLGIGGPLGQYFRGRPPDFFVTSGVQMRPPTATGWLTCLALRHKVGDQVGFGWFPESEPARWRGISETHSVMVSAQVHHVNRMYTLEQSLALQAVAISRLAENQHPAFKETTLRAIELNCGGGENDWYMESRFEYQAITRADGRCVDCRTFLRQFRHPQTGSVVMAGWVDRAPCGSPNPDHTSELEAFVDSVRPSERPAAAEDRTKP